MTSVSAAATVERPGPRALPQGARRAVGVGLMALIALVLAANLAQLAADPHAEFGSDWLWYVDGPNRLMSGEPLYDARFLAGPYVQLEDSLLYNWNQAPTLVVPIAGFALLVPDIAEVAAWSLLMALCIVGAFALVWPRRLSIAGSVLLALLLAVLPPPLWGFWWANASCLVALGTAMVIVGERRRDQRLIVAGLVVAGAAKIVPALPLAIWIILRQRRGAMRPLAISALVGVALLIPVVVAEGPSVISDFVTATRNALQAGSGSNVAPSGFLSLVMSREAALAVCWIAAGALVIAALRRRPDLVSLMLLIVASDLIIPNLWIHWLLPPMVVAVAMLGPAAVRRLDMVAGSPIPLATSDSGDARRVPAGGA